MLYAILGLVLSVSISGLIYFLRKDNQEKGKIEEENLILRSTNEALSNRPLTDIDLVTRLRERAANERKNQRQPDDT